MHHAGIQYGQGSMPSNSVQYNNVPELSVPSSTPSTTTALRQWRKKESTVVGPVEKPPLGQDQAVAAAAAPAPESQGPIARVAPQAHYPRPTEPYRYPHQYPTADYGLNCKDLSPAPVKYSEIVEPAHSSRLDHHLSPIIQKAKEKDYLDMCSVQNTQMNSMKHAYQNMHSTMIPPPPPPQYKESHMHHPSPAFTPYHIPNYKMNQYQRQYGNEGNFHLPLFNEQQFYQMDQRAYQNHHHQRVYRSQVAPSGYRPSVQGYGNMVQGYNYKPNVQNPHDPYSRMLPHTMQKYPDYKHLEGARRVYPENLTNYPAPRVSPNYAQCNQMEYAQHYQNRRHQEYLQQQQQELKLPYVQGQMPDLVPENTPKSSLKQYLETWNDDIPDIQDGKMDRGKESSLYILDSTEIPTENVQQFLHLQVDKLPENIKFLSAGADSVVKPDDPAESVKNQPEDAALNLAETSKNQPSYVPKNRFPTGDSTEETALNLSEGIGYQPKGTSGYINSNNQTEEAKLLSEEPKFRPVNLSEESKIVALNLTEEPRFPIMNPPKESPRDNLKFFNNNQRENSACKPMNLGEGIGYTGETDAPALNLTQDSSATVIRNNTSPKISVISETKKFLENETQKPDSPGKSTVIVYNEKKELHMPHLDKPVDHLGVIDELVKSSAEFLPSDTELPDIPSIEGPHVDDDNDEGSEPTRVGCEAEETRNAFFRGEQTEDDKTARNQSHHKKERMSDDDKSAGNRGECVEDNKTSNEEETKCQGRSKIEENEEQPITEDTFGLSKNISKEDSKTTKNPSKIAGDETENVILPEDQTMIEDTKDLSKIKEQARNEDVCDILRTDGNETEEPPSKSARTQVIETKEEDEVTARCNLKNGSKKITENEDRANKTGEEERASPESCCLPINKVARSEDGKEFKNEEDVVLKSQDGKEESKTAKNKRVRWNEEILVIKDCTPAINNFKDEDKFMDEEEIKHRDYYVRKDEEKLKDEDESKHRDYYVREDEEELKFEDNKNTGNDAEELKTEDANSTRNERVIDTEELKFEDGRNDVGKIKIEGNKIDRKKHGGDAKGFKIEENKAAICCEEELKIEDFKSVINKQEGDCVHTTRNKHVCSEGLKIEDNKTTKNNNRNDCLRFNAEELKTLEENKMAGNKHESHHDEKLNIEENITASKEEKEHSHGDEERFMIEEIADENSYKQERDYREMKIAKACLSKEDTEERAIEDRVEIKIEESKPIKNKSKLSPPVIVEGNYVLLQIAGEILEIVVDGSGRKKISVTPYKSEENKRENTEQIDSTIRKFEETNRIEETPRERRNITETRTDSRQWKEENQLKNIVETDRRIRHEERQTKDIASPNQNEEIYEETYTRINRRRGNEERQIKTIVASSGHTNIEAHCQNQKMYVKPEETPKRIYDTIDTNEESDSEEVVMNEKSYTVLQRNEEINTTSEQDRRGITGNKNEENEEPKRSGNDEMVGRAKNEEMQTYRREETRIENEEKAIANDQIEEMQTRKCINEEISNRRAVRINLMEGKRRKMRGIKEIRGHVATGDCEEIPDVLVDPAEEERSGENFETRQDHPRMRLNELTSDKFEEIQFSHKHGTLEEIEESQPAYNATILPNEERRIRNTGTVPKEEMQNNLEETDALNEERLPNQHENNDKIMKNEENRNKNPTEVGKGNEETQKCGDGDGNSGNRLNKQCEENAITNRESEDRLSILKIEESRKRQQNGGILQNEETLITSNPSENIGIDENEEMNIAKGDNSGNLDLKIEEGQNESFPNKETKIRNKKNEIEESINENQLNPIESEERKTGNYEEIAVKDDQSEISNLIIEETKDESPLNLIINGSKEETNPKEDILMLNEDSRMHKIDEKPANKKNKKEESSMIHVTTKSKDEIVMLNEETCVHAIGGNRGHKKMKKEESSKIHVTTNEDKILRIEGNISETIMICRKNAEDLIENEEIIGRKPNTQNEEAQSEPHDESRPIQNIEEDRDQTVFGRKTDLQGNEESCKENKSTPGYSEDNEEKQRNSEEGSVFSFNPINTERTNRSTAWYDFEGHNKDLNENYDRENRAEVKNEETLTKNSDKFEGDVSVQPIEERRSIEDFKERVIQDEERINPKIRYLKPAKAHSSNYEFPKIPIEDNEEILNLTKTIDSENNKESDLHFEEIYESIKMRLNLKKANDSKAKVIKETRKTSIPEEENSDRRFLKIRKNKKSEEIEEQDEDIEIIHTEENKIRFARKSTPKRRNKSGGEIASSKRKEERPKITTHKRRRSNLQNQDGGEFEEGSTRYTIETAELGEETGAKCFEEIEENSQTSIGLEKKNRRVSPLKIRIKRTRFNTANEDSEESTSKASEEPGETIWKISGCEEAAKNFYDYKEELMKNYTGCGEENNLQVMKDIEDLRVYKTPQAVKNFEDNRADSSYSNKNFDVGNEETTGKSTISSISSHNANMGVVDSDDLRCKTRVKNKKTSRNFEEIPHFEKEKYFVRRSLKDIKDKFEENYYFQANHNFRVEDNPNFEEGNYDFGNIIKRNSEENIQGAKYNEERSQATRCIDENNDIKISDEDFEKKHRLQKKESCENQSEEDLEENCRFQNDENELHGDKILIEDRAKEFPKFQIEEKLAESGGTEEIFNFGKKLKENLEDLRKVAIENLQQFGIEESVIKFQECQPSHKQKIETKTFRQDVNFGEKNVVCFEEERNPSKTNENTKITMPKEFFEDENRRTLAIVENDDIVRRKIGEDRQEIMEEVNQSKNIISSNRPNLEERSKIKDKKPLERGLISKIEKIVQKIEDRRNEESDKKNILKTRVTEESGHTESNSNFEEERSTSLNLKKSKNANDEVSLQGDVTGGYEDAFFAERGRIEDRCRNIQTEENRERIVIIEERRSNSQMDVAHGVIEETEDKRKTKEYQLNNACETIVEDNPTSHNPRIEDNEGMCTNKTVIFKNISCEGKILTRSEINWDGQRNVDFEESCIFKRTEERPEVIVALKKSQTSNKEITTRDLHSIEEILKKTTIPEKTVIFPTEARKENEETKEDTIPSRKNLEESFAGKEKHRLKKGHDYNQACGNEEKQSVGDEDEKIGGEESVTRCPKKDMAAEERKMIIVEHKEDEDTNLSNKKSKDIEDRGTRTNFDFRNTVENRSEERCVVGEKRKQVEDIETMHPYDDNNFEEGKEDRQNTDGEVEESKVTLFNDNKKIEDSNIHQVNEEPSLKFNEIHLTNDEIIEDSKDRNEKENFNIDRANEDIETEEHLVCEERNKDCKIEERNIEDKKIEEINVKHIHEERYVKFLNIEEGKEKCLIIEKRKEKCLNLEESNKHPNEDKNVKLLNEATRIPDCVIEEKNVDRRNEENNVNKQSHSNRKNEETAGNCEEIEVAASTNIIEDVEDPDALRSLKENEDNEDVSTALVECIDEESNCVSLVDEETLDYIEVDTEMHLLANEEIEETFPNSVEGVDKMYNNYALLNNEEIDSNKVIEATKEIEETTIISVDETNEPSENPFANQTTVEEIVLNDEEIEDPLLINEEIAINSIDTAFKNEENHIHYEGIEAIIISSDEDIDTSLLNIDDSILNAEEVISDDEITLNSREPEEALTTNEDILTTNEETEVTIFKNIGDIQYTLTTNKETEETILKLSEDIEDTLITKEGRQKITLKSRQGIENTSINSEDITNYDTSLNNEEISSDDKIDTSSLNIDVIEETIVDPNEEITTNEETAPNQNILLNSYDEIEEPVYYEEIKHDHELPFEENARSFSAEFEETYPKEETLIGSEEIVIDNLDHAMVNEIEIYDQGEESKEEIPLLDEEESSSPSEGTTFIIEDDNFEKLRIFQKKLVVKLTTEDELQIASYMKKQAEAQKKKASYKELIKKTGKKLKKKRRIRFKNLTSDEEEASSVRDDNIMRRDTIKKAKKKIEAQTTSTNTEARMKIEDQPVKKKSRKSKNEATAVAETIKEIADAVNEETYRQMNERAIEKRRKMVCDELENSMSKLFMEHGSVDLEVSKDEERKKVHDSRNQRVMKEERKCKNEEREKEGILENLELKNPILREDKTRKIFLKREKRKKLLLNEDVIRTSKIGEGRNLLLKNEETQKSSLEYVDLKKHSRQEETRKVKSKNPHLKIIETTKPLKNKIRKHFYLKKEETGKEPLRNEEGGNSLPPNEGSREVYRMKEEIRTVIPMNEERKKFSENRKSSLKNEESKNQLLENEENKNQILKIDESKNQIFKNEESKDKRLQNERSENNIMKSDDLKITILKNEETLKIKNSKHQILKRPKSHSNRKTRPSKLKPGDTTKLKTAKEEFQYGNQIEDHHPSFLKEGIEDFHAQPQRIRKSSSDEKTKCKRKKEDLDTSNVINLYTTDKTQSVDTEIDVDEEETVQIEDFRCTEKCKPFSIHLDAFKQTEKVDTTNLQKEEIEDIQLVKPICRRSADKVSSKDFENNHGNRELKRIEKDESVKLKLKKTDVNLKLKKEDKNTVIQYCSTVKPISINSNIRENEDSEFKKEEIEETRTILQTGKSRSIDSNKQIAKEEIINPKLKKEENDDDENTHISKVIKLHLTSESKRIDSNRKTSDEDTTNQNLKKEESEDLHNQNTTNVTKREARFGKLRVSSMKPNLQNYEKKKEDENDANKVTCLTSKENKTSDANNFDEEEMKKAESQFHSLDQEDESVQNIDNQNEESGEEMKKVEVFSSKHNFSIITRGKKDPPKIRTPSARNKKFFNLEESEESNNTRPKVNEVEESKPKLLKVKTKAELKIVTKPRSPPIKSILKKAPTPEKKKRLSLEEYNNRKRSCSSESEKSARSEESPQKQLRSASLEGSAIEEIVNYTFSSSGSCVKTIRGADPRLRNRKEEIPKAPVLETFFNDEEEEILDFEEESSSFWPEINNSRSSSSKSPLVKETKVVDEESFIEVPKNEDVKSIENTNEDKPLHKEDEIEETFVKNEEENSIKNVCEESSVKLIEETLVEASTFDAIIKDDKETDNARYKAPEIEEITKKIDDIFTLTFKNEEELVAKFLKGDQLRPDEVNKAKNALGKKRLSSIGTKRKDIIDLNDFNLDLGHTRPERPKLKEMIIDLDELLPNTNNPKKSRIDREENEEVYESNPNSEMKKRSKKSRFSSVREGFENRISFDFDELIPNAKTKNESSFGNEESEESWGNDYLRELKFETKKKSNFSPKITKEKNEERPKKFKSRTPVTNFENQLSFDLDGLLLLKESKIGSSFENEEIAIFENTEVIPSTRTGRIRRKTKIATTMGKEESEDKSKIFENKLSFNIEELIPNKETQTNTNITLDEIEGRPENRPCFDIEDKSADLREFLTKNKIMRNAKLKREEFAVGKEESEENLTTRNYRRNYNMGVYEESFQYGIGKNPRKHKIPLSFVAEENEESFGKSLKSSLGVEERVNIEVNSMKPMEGRFTRKPKTYEIEESYGNYEDASHEFKTFCPNARNYRNRRKSKVRNEGSFEDIEDIAKNKESFINITDKSIKTSSIFEESTENIEDRLIKHAIITKNLHKPTNQSSLHVEENEESRMNIEDKFIIQSGLATSSRVETAPSFRNEEIEESWENFEDRVSTVVGNNPATTGTCEERSSEVTADTPLSPAVVKHKEDFEPSKLATFDEESVNLNAILTNDKRVEQNRTEEIQFLNPNCCSREVENEEDRFLSRDEHGDHPLSSNLSKDSHVSPELLMFPASKEKNEDSISESFLSREERGDRSESSNPSKEDYHISLEPAMFSASEEENEDRAFQEGYNVRPVSSNVSKFSNNGDDEEESPPNPAAFTKKLNVDSSNQERDSRRGEESPLRVIDQRKFYSLSRKNHGDSSIPDSAITKRTTAPPEEERQKEFNCSCSGALTKEERRKHRELSGEERNSTKTTFLIEEITIVKPSSSEETRSHVKSSPVSLPNEERMRNKVYFSISKSSEESGIDFLKPSSNDKRRNQFKPSSSSLLLSEELEEANRNEESFNSSNLRFSPDVERKNYTSSRKKINSKPLSPNEERRNQFKPSNLLSSEESNCNSLSPEPSSREDERRNYFNSSNEERRNRQAFDSSIIEPSSNDDGGNCNPELLRQDYKSHNEDIRLLPSEESRNFCCSSILQSSVIDNSIFGGEERRTKFNVSSCADPASSEEERNRVNTLNLGPSPCKERRNYFQALNEERRNLYDSVTSRKERRTKCNSSNSVGRGREEGRCGSEDNKTMLVDNEEGEDFGIPFSEARCAGEDVEQCGEDFCTSDEIISTVKDVANSDEESKDVKISDDNPGRYEGVDTTGQETEERVDGEGNEESGARAYGTQHFEERFEGDNECNSRSKNRQQDNEETRVINKKLSSEIIEENFCFNETSEVCEDSEQVCRDYRNNFGNAEGSEEICEESNKEINRGCEERKKGRINEKENRAGVEENQDRNGANKNKLKITRRGDEEHDENEDLKGNVFVDVILKEDIEDTKNFKDEEHFGDKESKKDFDEEERKGDFEDYNANCKICEENAINTIKNFDKNFLRTEEDSENCEKSDVETMENFRGVNLLKDIKDRMVGGRSVDKHIEERRILEDNNTNLVVVNIAETFEYREDVNCIHPLKESRSEERFVDDEESEDCVKTIEDNEENCENPFVNRKCGVVKKANEDFEEDHVRNEDRKVEENCRIYYNQAEASEHFQNQKNPFDSKHVESLRIDSAANADHPEENPNYYRYDVEKEESEDYEETVEDIEENPLISSTICVSVEETRENDEKTIEDRLKYCEENYRTIKNQNGNCFEENHPTDEITKNQNIKGFQKELPKYYEDGEENCRKTKNQNVKGENFEDTIENIEYENRSHSNWEGGEEDFKNDEIKESYADKDCKNSEENQHAGKKIPRIARNQKDLGETNEDNLQNSSNFFIVTTGEYNLKIEDMHDEKVHSLTKKYHEESENIEENREFVKICEESIEGENQNHRICKYSKEESEEFEEIIKDSKVFTSKLNEDTKGKLRITKNRKKEDVEENCVTTRIQDAKENRRMNKNFKEEIGDPEEIRLSATVENYFQDSKGKCLNEEIDNPEEDRLTFTTLKEDFEETEGKLKYKIEDSEEDHPSIKTVNGLGEDKEKQRITKSLTLEFEDLEEDHLTAKRVIGFHKSEGKRRITNLLKEEIEDPKENRLRTTAVKDFQVSKRKRGIIKRLKDEIEDPEEDQLTCKTVEEEFQESNGKYRTTKSLKEEIEDPQNGSLKEEIEVLTTNTAIEDLQDTKEMRRFNKSVKEETKDAVEDRRIIKTENVEGIEELCEYLVKSSINYKSCLTYEETREKHCGAINRCDNTEKNRSIVTNLQIKNCLQSCLIDEESNENCSSHGGNEKTLKASFHTRFSEQTNIETAVAEKNYFSIKNEVYQQSPRLRSEESGKTIRKFCYSCSSSKETYNNKNKESLRESWYLRSSIQDETNDKSEESYSPRMENKVFSPNYKNARIEENCSPLIGKEEILKKSFWRSYEINNNCKTCSSSTINEDNVNKSSGNKYAEKFIGNKEIYDKYEESKEACCSRIRRNNCEEINVEKSLSHSLKTEYKTSVVSQRKKEENMISSERALDTSSTPKRAKIEEGTKCVRFAVPHLGKRKSIDTCKKLAVTGEGMYESVLDSEDLKLHLKKVDGKSYKPKRARRRRRNKCPHIVGSGNEEAVIDYSVFEARTDAGIPKLIIKRNAVALACSGNLQPVVRIQRDPALDDLARRLKT